MHLVSEWGYTHYNLRECSGRNELFYGKVNSLRDCRTLCTTKQHGSCVSFEWWGESNSHPTYGANWCQLSSSCTYELSVAASPSDPADLYVKEGDNYITKILF